MRILAIETAVMSGSIAALQADILCAEIALDPARRTTRTLTPAMKDILEQVGWDPTDVHCIAVSIGPGSFTGLRIGVTAAKAFAYATGANVFGINTLRILAAQVPIADSPLWVVMNAERNQVYAGQFRATAGMWQETAPPTIIDVSDLISRLGPGVLLSGPALQDFKASLPPGIAFTAEHLWRPRAATVGQLAYRDFQVGRRDDLWSLSPFYLRDSAASEKTKR